MKILKNILFFAFGGSAYVGLELLYRGRSHISMFCAGGLSFLLLGRLNRTRLSLPIRAVLGTVIITAVELATGLLVNRDYVVWDYRQQPYNFRGQICPLFILLWLPLSMIAMGLYRDLDLLWEKAHTV